MNKKIISAAVGIILVAIIAVFAIFILRQNAPDTTPAETSPTQESQPSQSTNGTSDAPVSAEKTQVEIEDFAFQPGTITVKKGTTVQWTNKDDVQHNVLSDEGTDGSISSKLLAKGESYSMTFNTVGEFPYHCTPHPQMKGTVKVVE